jgi:hypothetical protein
MNKIVIGAVTAVVIGVGAAAGWYFLGKDSGPGLVGTASAPAIDCNTAKADIDAAFASLAPETKATYAGLQCDAAKLTFAEVRFAGQNAGGTETGAFKLTGVVVDGVFFDNIKKIFNPAAYAGQPVTDRLPLINKLTAAKVTIGPEQGGAAFDDLAIVALGARQFAKAPPLGALGSMGPADAIDALQAFAFDSLGFKNLSGGEPGAAPALTVAAIDITAFDGITLGGLDITTLAAQKAGEPGKVGIASISLKGLGIGDLAALAKAAPGMADADTEGLKALMAVSFDSAALKGFDGSGFESPDDSVKIASLTIDKMKALATARIALEGLEGYSSEAEVSFKLGHLILTGVDIGTAMQGMVAGTATEPDFAKLRVDGYDLADLAVGPKTGDKVTLASLIASSSDYVDGIATRGTAKLTGFVFPATVIESETDRQPLIDLGYDALKLEMNVDYAYDPKAKSMDMKDFTLKLLDGGALSLSFNFGDFDVKALQEASAAMQPPLALMGAKVVKLSLGYVDDSLISRILKVAAKEQGQTPEALMAQAKQMVAMQAESAPGPVTKAAVEAVAKFLDNPKSLTIALAPPTPVTFAEIGAKFEDLEGLAKSLGLTITAN